MRQDIIRLMFQICIRVIEAINVGQHKIPSHPSFYINISKFVQGYHPYVTLLEGYNMINLSKVMALINLENRVKCEMK